jgi:transposase InsO family protein
VGGYDQSGFVYLAVVLDWFSRRLLAWRLSITMEASFCVEALEDALAHHGKPALVNTDQGSQFTGSAFTRVLTRQVSRSAWMAKALGGTMSLSSDYGAPSNTRRYICEPMRASARHAL